MAWHKPAAYERCRAALYPPGLFPKVPQLMELQPLVAHWKAGEVARQFHEDMKAESRPVVVAVTDMDGDPRGDETAADGQHRAEGAAHCAPAAGRDGVGARHARRARAAAAQPRVRDRQRAARLLSHTLFPFQLRTFLAELGWIYIALTFGAIVVVLVQMKRNEILRRLTALEPGKPGGWDSAFFWRIVVFALLPLLTLFAAQFPDIGGVLLQWAGSARSALP